MVPGVGDPNPCLSWRLTATVQEFYLNGNEELAGNESLLLNA
jgi:hypothetical protein